MGMSLAAVIIQRLTAMISDPSPTLGMSACRHVSTARVDGDLPGVSPIWCDHPSHRHYGEEGPAENQSRASRRRSINTAMSQMMAPMKEMTAMVGLNRNHASKFSNTAGTLPMAKTMLIQRAQFFRLRAISHIQTA